MITWLAACAGSKEPTFAIDSIVLEPDGVDIHAFQTWYVMPERWARKANVDPICTVVATFDGTPAAGPPQVEWAWVASVPDVIDSDCDPLWLRTQDFPTSAKAFGLGVDVGDKEAPYPGQTQRTWIDEGYGWTEHGMAWPSVLDEGGTTLRTQWTGTEPYSAWATLAWDLR